MNEPNEIPHQWFCGDKEPCACMDSWKQGGYRRAQLLAELRSWHGDTDPEIAHGAADKALLACIDDPEITEAFEAIQRWYA